MEEFKIGDKVEFISPSGHGSNRTRKGDICTVLSIHQESEDDDEMALNVRTSDGRTYDVYSWRFKKVIGEWDE